MPIIVSEPTAERGRKDAKRHREKQRDAIKKKLPEIISNEAIITKRQGKIVKIPIRSIEIPRFKPARPEVPTGIGQGPAKPGDVIGERPGDGSGGAGQEPGVDYVETEVDIEELIELMLEDLGLPRLQDKEVKDLAIELGFRIAGIRKSGPWVLLDKRSTVKEGIKRFWVYLRRLQQETGCDELKCFRALKQAQGILNDALSIIRNDSITLEVDRVDPFPILANEDLRYREIKDDTEYQSRAAVIAMMDVSGSMTEMKKYFARSMLFWLVEFLRKIYQQVEIRFVTHHTSAKIVDEESFFKTGESGGTFCYTAYELANSLMEVDYPTDRWNVYVWHFSDGDDFDVSRTIEEIKKLFNRGINMLGYGEIKPDEDPGGGEFSELWNSLRDRFSLNEEAGDKFSMIVGSEKLPVLGVLITEREQILFALKEFLKKERWAS